jgi:Phage derived protein Gp49-like (DUF891)
MLGRAEAGLFCCRRRTKNGTMLHPMGTMVLLHAFIKKTQKTPPGDLELAIRRKREIT